MHPGTFHLSAISQFLMLDQRKVAVFTTVFITVWLLCRLLSSNKSHEQHTVFLYSAVYDDRTPEHRVRILGYSRCFGDETTLEVVDGKRSSLSSAEVIASWRCPEKWAAGFDYQEFEFVTEPLWEKPSEITFIVNSTRSITLPVRSRNVERDETLEMCVVPLFWYANWPRLLTWIEHWRSHHKASFVIYKHTVSKNVHRLLEYYERKGVVKIIPWPQMPINGKDDLRTQLYRIGNKISANDCLSRASNKFSAWLDVDEYVSVSSNKTLLDFAREKSASDDTWGSLAFEHFALAIPPIDETFNFIEFAEIHKAKGPQKVLYKPSRIHHISAHKIEKFIGMCREVKVNQSEAKLLHMRLRFPHKLERQSRGKYSDFTPEFRDQLLSISHEIYGSDLPHVDVKALVDANDNCLNRSRNERTRRGPATPYQPETCADLMGPLDEWIVAQPTEDSRYYYV